MLKKQNSDLETKISYKILKVILYALLLTPLWVWSAFLFPFITSKVIYLRLGVELSLVFYIPLALKYPELRPRWNWLSGMVWIYLGALLVTSAFGFNFYKSFWGTVERGEGIVTMLHFGLYFLMLPAVFRAPRDWRRYLAAALAVISLTGLLSVGQVVCGEGNLEGLCSFVPPAQGTRVSASIGNAAFYAAFMLFGTMLSLLLGLQSESRAWKLAWLGNAVFNAVMVVYTQTRGGAIGLYLALFLVVLFHVFRSSKRAVKMVFAGLAVLMVLIPAGLFLKPEIFPERVREIVVVRRIMAISMDNVTTQSRLDTWGASLRAWQGRFWTGYGYENYNIAFNKYFPPRVFKDAGSQIWFDRAHNTILDVAVTAGIGGLAAYLGIFAAALLYLFRLLRAPDEGGRSAAILIALLAGYFVSNLFVFDTHATYLMFFLALAYIAFLREDRLGQSAAPVGRSFGSPQITAAAALIAMVAAGYFVNVRPALANLAAISAFKTVRAGESRLLESDFRRAMSYGTYMDEEIRQHMIEYVRQVGGSGKLSEDERKALYSYAASELENNVVASPNDAKNYLYLINFYNQTGQDLGRIERTFELGRKGLELSPTRMQIYFELGQAAFSIGRSEEGLEYFRQGVALNPEPKESHLNYLIGAIFAGRDDLASEEFREIAARSYLLTASEEASIANAYSSTCRVAEARAHVEEAVKIDPSLAAAAENFLANLHSRCGP